MRWSNLTLEAQAGTALPGYRDPAVVRRFDAPEALDVRFYEVHAKSVLNRVPERSRMPFRWTINPYRGCTHACVYCLSGDTEILLADGNVKALADVAVGDRVLGTQMRGRHRRYVETPVLAHWSTVKPAHRVTLADGTELTASGDHRFLTDRGWKFVRREGARPHLTTANALVGTGRFAARPQHSADYRRGYLCGYARASADHPRDELDQLRLVLPGDEATARFDRYVEESGVALAAAGAGTGQATARPGRTNRHGGGRRAAPGGEWMERWPLSPSDEWRKGFLAGAYDASGSFEAAPRITSTDHMVVEWALSSLRHLGFDAAVESAVHEGEPRSVLVRGGLHEHVRFIHTVDPAVAERRALAGRAIAARDELKVASVEALGVTMRLFDITTGTGDFIANGVVSHNCFARPTHTYLDFDAGRDFEREIVVKVNAPEVARVELSRPRWGREHVAMGTNTDPYQWVESKYRLMPGIWEALRDTATPCSVLTKSPLVLRDLPLLRQIAEVTSVSANLSVPTLEPKAWRATEPHTPHPRARLEAVAELNRAGIPTGILVAPLMPGINDDPRQVEAILQAATDAGATGVGGIALHLRGEVRGVFMDWLRSERPDLVARYEDLYAKGAYAPVAERERLSALIRRGARPGPFRRQDTTTGFTRDPRHDADPAPAPPRLTAGPGPAQQRLSAAGAPMRPRPDAAPPAARAQPRATAAPAELRLPATPFDRPDHPSAASPQARADLARRLRGAEAQCDDTAPASPSPRRRVAGGSRGPAAGAAGLTDRPPAAPEPAQGSLF